MAGKNLALIAISVLVLSGCVNFEFSEEIKRNEKMDLTAVFKADNELLMNRTLGLAKASGFPGEPVVSDSRNSVTYSLKDQNVETLEFGQLSRSLSKEFRFPYYYYTYNWTYGDLGLERYDQGAAYFPFARNPPVEHRVKVFGRITETNARQTRKDEVVVNLRGEHKGYYVRFRELFVLNFAHKLAGEARKFYEQLKTGLP